jgi:hypothetical protein
MVSCKVSAATISTAVFPSCVHGLDRISKKLDYTVQIMGDDIDGQE